MICDVTLWTQSGVKSRKIEYLSRLFQHGAETCTVVTIITKFHDMSTVTFLCQHNGLQALSIQRGKSEFSSFEVLFAHVVQSVGIREYGHYTAQAQESLFSSGATNKAFYILGHVYENIRLRPSTRRRIDDVFKFIHFGERFRIYAFTVSVFIVFVWTEGLNA